MEQPSKRQVIEKLEAILDERLSREQVVDWAMEFINNDEMELTDFQAWELLKRTGGVDAIESPDVYLYSFDDIKRWIAECAG